MTNNYYDIIIIGSGMAGLFSAYNIQKISPDTSFLPADPNFSNDLNEAALAGNIRDNSSTNFSTVELIFSLLIDEVISNTLPPSTINCLSISNNLIIGKK